MRGCLRFCGSVQDIGASLNYEYSLIHLFSFSVMCCLLEIHGPLQLIADLSVIENNHPEKPTHLNVTMNTPLWVVTSHQDVSACERGY